LFTFISVILLFFSAADGEIKIIIFPPGNLLTKVELSSTGTVQKGQTKKSERLKATSNLVGRDPEEVGLIDCSRRQSVEKKSLQKDSV